MMFIREFEQNFPDDKCWYPGCEKKAIHWHHVQYGVSLLMHLCPSCHSKIHHGRYRSIFRPDKRPVSSPVDWDYIDIIKKQLLQEKIEKSRPLYNLKGEVVGCCL